MTLEDFRESIETHFWAPLYTMLAMLPEMRRRRQGRIVNISSIAGRISVPHLVPYSAGKFALAGLSEGMRVELSKSNIRVTSVYPGLMRAGSPRNAFFKGKHRSEYRWFSISDAFPLSSISAESAARSIVEACERGKATVVLSLPAKLGIKVHDLLPGVSTFLLSVISKLMLPGPGGIGQQRALGKQSFSCFPLHGSPPLDERAARRNNQVA
jgi:short-subunit dehydrogenase